MIRSHTRPALALLLSGLMFLGILALSGAAPQKKPKKPVKPTVSAAKMLAAQGKKVYDRSGCNACHTIAGKGGKMGPALTAIGKEHNAAWITAHVRDPKAHTPQSAMPPFGPDQISDKDLKALSAYLESLKK